MPFLKFTQPAIPVYPRTFTPHVGAVSIRDHDGDGPLAPKARGLKISGPTPTPGGNPDQVPLAQVENVVSYQEYPGTEGSAEPEKVTIAIGDNEFILVFIKPGDGLDPMYDSLFVQHGVYDPQSDSTELSPRICVLGGGSGAAAIPPFTDTGESFNYWGLGRSFGCLFPQIVMLDDVHGVLRFFDQGGNTDSVSFGTGNYYQSVAACLLTFDWDANTVSHGPFSVIEQDIYFGGYAYEDQYDVFSQRLTVLPDGRLFHGTTNWNWTAIVCVVGRVDLNTGVITWGTKWKDPTAETVGGTDWQAFATNLLVTPVAATRVSMWWYTRANYNKIALLDVANDDTITLNNWAHLTPYPDSTELLNYDFGPSSLIQPQPGHFVLWQRFSRPGPNDSENDLYHFSIDNISSNAGVWSLALQTEMGYVDPIFEGAGADSYYSPDMGCLVHIADGNFVLLWEDRTDRMEFGDTGLDTYYGDPKLVYAASFVMFPNGSINKGFQTVISGIPHRNSLPGDVYNFAELQYAPGLATAVHSSTDLDLIVYGLSYRVGNVPQNPSPPPYLDFSGTVYNLYASILKVLPSC